MACHGPGTARLVMCRARPITCRTRLLMGRTVKSARLGSYFHLARRRGFITAATRSEKTSTHLFTRPARLTLTLPLRDACSAPKLPFPDPPPRLFPSPVKMMSGGGYSALDDPKASGSVPVSTHQPLAHRPSLLAPHLSRLAQAATGPDPQTIKFTESNLQTFPPSEAKGKISGAYRPPTDSDGEIRSPPLYSLL